MHHQASNQVSSLSCSCRNSADARSSRQNAIGGKGFYVNVHEEKRSMKLGEFKKVAQEQSAFGTSSRRGGRDVPSSYTPEVLADLEKKFWRNILFNPPMYGADCPVPKGTPPPLAAMATRLALPISRAPRITGARRRVPGGRAGRAVRPAGVRGLGPGAAGEPADHGPAEARAGGEHALPVRGHVPRGLRVALRGYGPAQHQLRPLRRP
jgi:hypothetical protein